MAAHHGGKRAKLFYLFAVVALLILGNAVCTGCSTRDRLTYSLALGFAALLIWDCFFGKTVMVGTLPVSRDNVAARYFVLAIASFWAIYALFLFFSH